MDKAEKTILVVLLSVIGGCAILAVLCGGVLYLANKFLPEPTIATTVESPTHVPDKSPTPKNQADSENIKTADRDIKFAGKYGNPNR